MVLEYIMLLSSWKNGHGALQSPGVLDWTAQMHSANNCLLGLIWGRQKVWALLGLMNLPMQRWTEDIGLKGTYINFVLCFLIIFLPSVCFRIWTRVGNLWPIDQICPAVCFYIVDELRMGFTFLSEKNQTKNNNSCHIKNLCNANFGAHKSSFIGKQPCLFGYLQCSLWLRLCYNCISE